MHSHRPVFTRPKVLPPPPPPCFSSSLSSLNFYYGINSDLKLGQPSINLLEFRTFYATKVWLFSTHYSQIIHVPFCSSYFNYVCGPCLLVLPCVTHSSRGFFVLFFMDNFINSTFKPQSVYSILNLLGEHPLIKLLGKHGKTIRSQHRQAHGRLRIITSIWKVLF